MQNAVDTEKSWPTLKNALLKSVNDWNDVDVNYFINICNSVGMSDSQQSIDLYECDEFFDQMKDKVQGWLENDRFQSIEDLV